MSELILHFDDPQEADAVSGRSQTTLRAVEEALQVKLTARDTWLKVEGESDPAAQALAFFEFLRRLRRQGEMLPPSTVSYTLNAFRSGREAELNELIEQTLDVSPKRRPVAPKTLGQARFIKAIREHDVTFAVGPAGTGKTYLAMAAAVTAFSRGEVGRIILTRPAIEAGEALGFLPGDLQQKILPYLRPLYDALYDMMGPDEIQRNIDQGIVEVAPLAYMRGRTLNNAFVILDEAQNTTPGQMFMFLTRLGREAKAVITGDLTQVDLPGNKESGLREAQRLLTRLKGIAFHEFEGADVVRHGLVRKIIAAWESDKS